MSDKPLVDPRSTYRSLRFVQTPIDPVRRIERALADAHSLVDEVRVLHGSDPVVMPMINAASGWWASVIFAVAGLREEMDEWPTDPATGIHRIHGEAVERRASFLVPALELARSNASTDAERAAVERAARGIRTAVAFAIDSIAAVDTLGSDLEASGAAADADAVDTLDAVEAIEANEALDALDAIEVSGARSSREPFRDSGPIASA